MRRLLVLFLFIWVSSPVAAQSMLRSDVPDWVEVVALPDMKAELYRQVMDGENFRLLDRQVRWVGTVRETYVRVATEVVNRSGLEAIATISRDFDPNIDTLTLVQLDVLRDGVRSSVIDGVTEELIRRETRLESGIIDGTLTAYMTVPGVRVGDIVDTAFVWRSEEYFPGFNFTGRYQLEYSVPVGLNRLVVHWPNERAVDFGEQPEGVEAVVEVGPLATRYEWQMSNLSSRQIDDNSPAEHSPWAAIEISGYESWNDVSASLAGYYLQERAVPDQWRARVDAIAEGYDTDSKRAFAALRLVQDDIRYVGLEVGAGGYFARDPETVVSNAFGDCKDKSLLLKTILQDLGIGSSVALASLEEGYGIIDRLPSAQVFDHMIVGALLGDEMIWMDPTGVYEGGGPRSAMQPDYGYVLPLSNQETTLTKIEVADRPRFFRNMTETFWFSFAGAILSVETVFLGESANWERSYWAGTPVENIANEYLKYYAENYPGIRAINAPEIVDVRGDNQIIVTESYLIPRAYLQEENLYGDFPFISANSFDAIPTVQIGERKDPLAVRPGVQLVHSVRVRNAPIEFIAPDHVEIEGSAFSQNFSAKTWEGGNMDLTWEYQSRVRSVPAGEVRGVIKDAKNAREFSAYSWDFRIEEKLK